MSYITIYILYVLYNYIYTLHYYTQYTIRMREETTTTPSIFTVTLVTLSRSHQNTPRHPPFGLTARSAVPRIPSTLASRSPLNPP